MKKLLFTALVVFMGLFTFNAQAQSLDLGVKLGANFAKVKDITHANNKTGMLAGVFVGINFENWGIQPEILYSQQGAETDWGDFNLDYVSVPLMFKYNIIGDFLNVQVGPQFGFLVNNDDSLGDQAGTVGDQLKTKDFDLSGAAGLGLKLPLGFRVSARYHFGFTDVANSLGPNEVVSVAVGFSFL